MPIQQQYGRQACHVAVGKYTVVSSNSKGAAGKVSAEVSWRDSVTNLLAMYRYAAAARVSCSMPHASHISTGHSGCLCKLCKTVLSSAITLQLSTSVNLHVSHAL